jgi:hypothetical protein
MPREARPYATHPWVIANDRLVAAGWTANHSNEEALVSADDRPHWDDLPAGRRRAFILAGAGAAVVAAAAGMIGAVTALTARARRHRS